MLAEQRPGRRCGAAPPTSGLLPKGERMNGWTWGDFRSFCTFSPQKMGGNRVRYIFNTCGNVPVVPWHKVDKWWYRFVYFGTLKAKELGKFFEASTMNHRTNPTWIIALLVNEASNSLRHKLIPLINRLICIYIYI